MTGFHNVDFLILTFGLVTVPANLTPEYFKAEEWFRSATTNQEKILALERMLSVMPKHKGTDHLKADLRRKLSKLKETAVQKKSSKHVDIFHVPRSGAGQVVLLGTPNCGKSSIVAALTNAKVNVADFPFATAQPVPGMVLFEDVQIQLVDMPPITADYIAPGQVGTYRNCDLIALVIDLSADVQEQLLICLDFLESRSLLIDRETPAYDDQGNALGKRAFCICTKSDIAAAGALEELKDSFKQSLAFMEISAATGAGLEELSSKLFELLGIIRIYAKPPGKPADMTDPFTLPVGSTVMDLAVAIHRQLAEKLKSARIWGTGVYDGQNAQRTHVLNDKDIVELHF
ncbi:MAG: 50S ribosome-binding GTPase [Phycisphaerales bacterium]|nr:MAG: 50S ribosome-binding GTPase [Phycisphaerales bacterium]